MPRYFDAYRIYPGIGARALSDRTTSRTSWAMDASAPCNPAG